MILEILSENLVIILLLLIVVFVLLYKSARSTISELRLQLSDLSARKQSLSTKYGKMSEQFFPFLEQYPYDRNNFRFIGNPIDGVQFEDNKIIFVEFKAGSSSLSVRQREIRDLINKGKVEFREFRVG
jgi:predicted Holliday junction resolvase-like endonuclease